MKQNIQCDDCYEDLTKEEEKASAIDGEVDTLCDDCLFVRRQGLDYITKE